MNPSAEIEFPKNQYKKFIKDVVTGTLERSELIEETVNKFLANKNNIEFTRLKNYLYLKHNITI